MKKVAYNKHNQGFSLVEAILAIALFSVIGMALITTVLYAEETSKITGQRARAVSLSEEGLQAVKNLKDSNFALLAAGTYGLSLSGSQWNLVAAPDITDALYYRTITITQINATTFDVLSSVVWQQNAQRSGVVSLTERLRDYSRQSQYTETTVADFTAGTRSGLDVTNTAGGEMQLSATASWATPVISGSYDTYNNISANTVFLNGNFAYVGTKNNNGNTCACGNDPEFYILNLSTPGTPTLVGSLNLGVDINSVTVSGNYAYVATSDNAAEMKIINITNQASPVLVVGGVYNTPGNGDGLSIANVGTTIYLGVQSSNTSNEFFIINAAIPATPTLLGSFNVGNVGSDVNDIKILGNFAYLATQVDAAELRILNVFNPASITSVGAYNATGNGDGRGVELSGSTIYLTRDNAGAATDFHIINVSNPASPSLMGELNLAANNIDVTVLGTTAFVGSASPNFLIPINISNPSAPSVITQFNIGGQGSSVAVFGSCVIAVGSNNSAEFQRVCSSAGGGSYATSGTFTSQAINSGSATTAWKKMSWTQTVTNPDTIQIQIRTAPDSAGVPGTWTSFQGPTGTGDYYTDATGATALNSAHSDGTNDQWIQYKVIFSGSGTSTPIFKDITFNYQ